MSGHDALRYVSRYLGKRTEKDDSSLKVPPALSSGLKGSIYNFRLARIRGPSEDFEHTFHLSISSVSQGLSFLYVEGMLAVVSGLRQKSLLRREKEHEGFPSSIA